jgi:hypothetical protein
MGKVFKKVANIAFLGMVPAFNEKEKAPNLQSAPVAAAPAEQKVQADPVTAGATQDEIQAAVDAERKRRAALNQYQPDDEQLALMTGKQTVLGG